MSELEPSTLSMVAKQLVDVNAVVERVGESKSWIYERCRNGLIPHVRIGRKVKFDMEKVEEWITNGGTPFKNGWRKEAK